MHSWPGKNRWGTGSLGLVENAHSVFSISASPRATVPFIASHDQKAWYAQQNLWDMWEVSDSHNSLRLTRQTSHTSPDYLGYWSA